MTHDNYPTRYDAERARQTDYGRSQNGASAAAPKKARGHDAVLRAIQGSGQDIFVLKMDGETRKGRLIAFDQFTLTVLIDGTRRVMFKHDISEFYTQGV